MNLANRMKCNRNCLKVLVVVILLVMFAPLLYNIINFALNKDGKKYSYIIYYSSTTVQIMKLQVVLLRACDTKFRIE